jgi:quercetin dioxygenase-like cupin family protein
MAQGKVTSVHIHPDADEVFYVLEGEIIVHVEGGVEHRIQQGDFALALRGVPHAFMATTETRLCAYRRLVPVRRSSATPRNRPPTTASMAPWTSAGYKRRPTITAG